MSPRESTDLLNTKYGEHRNFQDYIFGFGRAHHGSVCYLRRLVATMEFIRRISHLISTATGRGHPLRSRPESPQQAASAT